MADRNSRPPRTSKRPSGSRGAGRGETAGPRAAGDPEAGAEPIVIAERITVIAEVPLADDAAAIAPAAGADDVDAPGSAGVTSEQRYLLIAARAYERARERGFAPGRELEDWLLAEREVDTRLADGG